MSTAKKIWFITGISRGLGKALAEAALMRGDTVIGTSRDGHVEIDKSAGKLHVFALDVTNRAQVEAVMQEAYLIDWRLDVIVNNAGYGLLGSVEATKPAEFDHVMNVNFVGMVNVTQAALPILREQKSGHIVNISSIAGLAPMGGNAFYAASKFAMEGFSMSLAHELKELGIKVTIVEPGAFRTDFLAESSIRHTKETVEDYADTVGKVLTKLENMNGKQLGDPARGARAIIAAIDADEPPLHLILGSDAYKRASDHFAAFGEEMERWKHVSLSTDFAELARA